MNKGIYCLVFRNPACTVRIGALGDMALGTGWHVYVGSALGSGGLKRLERHIRFNTERNRPPKWHVDYLLMDPRFSLSYAVFAATPDRLECRLAGALRGEPVMGFGCSDCDCTSHLIYRRKDPQQELIRAFRYIGLDPAIKRIMSPDVNATV